jgi:hypothetical protein
MKRINKQPDVGFEFVEFNEGQQTEYISIEQYNKEIDEALVDVAEGNFIIQEELEKQSAEWYKRYVFFAQ